MADAKKTEAPADGEAPKKKSKLLLIIIVGVLVLAIGGAGAFFMLKKPPAEEGDEEAEEDHPPAKVVKKKKKKDEHAAPPAFVKLDPFVVKLRSDGQEAYAQVIPELKLSEAPIADQIKQFMPEIRHKLLMVIAAKTPAELSTPEGMQLLANQIRESINQTLDGSKADPALEKQDSNEHASVTAVFFSSLIVQ